MHTDFGQIGVCLYDSAYIATTQLTEQRGIQRLLKDVSVQREIAITAMPAVEMRFPHTPTKGENKHRPALPITRDWQLKYHPTAPASTGLDSCIDITSRA
ncbi:hypothetical protein TNCV_4060671 [Trichonephila clavipes]|nr:hypothetical protein TNCV_4060671 [Trichonephila clavipes]